MLTIRNSNKFVKNGQKSDEKWKFYSKMRVNDHQMSDVKHFITPKASIYKNGGHFR